MPVGVRDGRCTRSPFFILPVFDIPVLLRPPWSIKWSQYQTSDVEVPQSLADLVNIGTLRVLPIRV